MASTPAKSGASTDRHDALSEALAESWWAVGLRGILAIAFGLICLLVPTAAILALILLFSAYMLVDGVFAIASGIKAARNGERWGLLVLEGVVDIAAGAIAFLWPAITAVAFVILIAVWAIISGALMLGLAHLMWRKAGRAADYGDTTTVLLIKYAPFIYAIVAFLLMAGIIHFYNSFARQAPRE